MAGLASQTPTKVNWLCEELVQSVEGFKIKGGSRKEAFYRERERPSELIMAK